MRTNRNLEAIDRIADLSAKLADEAATIGLKSLVYILRMAEIEARQSTTPRLPLRKQAKVA